MLFEKTKLENCDSCASLIDKEFWDSVAPSWSNYCQAGGDKYRQKALGLMMDSLGDLKNKTVLDLGCGDGSVSRMICSYALSVIGVDISPKMLYLAEQYRQDDGSDNIKYVLSSASELDELESESFDVITSFFSMMSILQFQGSIQESSRLLKRDGLFYITLYYPNLSSRNSYGEELVLLEDIGVNRQNSEIRFVEHWDGYKEHNIKTVFYFRSFCLYLDSIRQY